MVKKLLEEPVRITATSQCLHEFDLLKEALLIEETEDTWQNIDASLKRFTAAIRGGACDHHDEFLKRWKETDIVRGLVNAMSTERTRLSGTALDLVAATSRLGGYWDSAVPFYAPTIIKLLGRASKIYVTRATITLTSLIKGTKSPAFIPYLIDGISEKSVTIRIGCADALLCCLSDIINDTEECSTRKPRSKDALNKRLNDVENAIKVGGRDRDPKVRAIFKRIWELYERQWPARAASLAQPLTPTIKRYLGIGSTLTSSHASHTSHASSNGLANREINPSREKVPPSAHRRTGSKNAAEAPLPPATKITGAHASKSIKSHNSHSALSKAGDLATLQKAMMVPLPPDKPEHREPSVSRGPGRAGLISTRTKTPAEGSIHQSQSSGRNMKRSNSTMRAQRVPLPSQTDPPASSTVTKPRTATRVPLQPISSVGVQPVKDVPIKPNQTSATVPTHHPISTEAVASNASSEASKALFKPARPASAAAQAVSKPSHQSQQPPPTLHTRPLPRRAAQEASNDKPFDDKPSNDKPSKDKASNDKASNDKASNDKASNDKASNDKPASEPLVINTLNVSVRSHTRKIQTEESAPILKISQPFRPTKSCSKSSSNAVVTSSKPPSTKPDPNSKSDSAAASISGAMSSQPTKAPMQIDELPEALRLPVLTPLPSSPMPPLAPLSSSMSSLPATHPVSKTESLFPAEVLSSSVPLPPSTTSPPAETLPSLEPLPPSITLLPSESQPPREPQQLSKPIPESLPPPATPLPPVAVQLTSSLPAQTTSSHDAVKSGLTLPVEVISQKMTFNQSLPSKPAPVASQSSNVPLKPFSIFLSSFGTPGPKICKALPDDLIVPMSVPLPPSPNSPYIGLNQQVNPKGSARKPNRSQRSPRLRKQPSSSRSSVKVADTEGNHENGEITAASSPTHPNPTCQLPAVQEGVLVDFDHEDTIWIPRPPTLHQDLLQLENHLGVTPASDEASDGEDGPQEKRPRVDTENSRSSADSTFSITRGTVEALCVPPEVSTPRQHPPRRDPSIFYWDQPDLETDGEDSGDKTISCLKEEPPSFSEDVTVNDGSSFRTNFLGGIDAQNQSTPASGGVCEAASRRLKLANLSPQAS
ncbi:hypothetical protein PCANC_07781 [Puccinia coronata f. sp. avenae]|uniref:CLASP N-terminal domain-containing protein n=1 Tax=Puccinia coronata f. sp. avenae TaxID=200324 RepID=A0A2N5S5F3_9BASI|nr:hypothetical protein PCASD_22329 [Puccinia coronata f. sp. avenae]PLW49400.1 hypothetical protein PCANC_07781 [Puccinia coronata f. sp. avenae]